MDTADFPTEMGSVIYKGFRSRGDAAVVMALKAAGASIIGKTTTTAFASSDPTATLNPRNTAHTPGGSSSGSAAAVGGRHDSAGAGDADRRLGDPAGLVLRLCGDQAVLPAAADGRRQMLFLDAGYGRAVRRRRSRRRARTGGDDRPGRIAAAGIGADAADRRGDAGFCRRPGGRKAPRRCGSRRRRPSAPAPRCARWRCRRSSPKPGARIRTCRNSRRIRRWPGNTARTTTRWRQTCADGSTRARA